MNAPPDPVAALLAEIASCDSAFRLMELLMRFCRDQAAAYRAWDEPEFQARATSARAEAKRVAEDEVGGIFSPDDPPEVVQPIRTAVVAYLRPDDPPPVVRATFLLQALDEKLTLPLRALYSHFRPGPLHPNQLFPVYWPDLRSNGWLPRNRLSTRPSRLSQPPEFLPPWGLAPPAATFSGREVAFVFPKRSPDP